MYTSRSPRQPVLESCCNDGIKVAFVTRPLDGYTATRRYWRLQEPCLPTLLPMYHCSAIVVYGYATYLGGSIVWKYPTAVPYVQALLNMTNRRQLSHRNNNITVYFTLGGEREDSRNLSFVAGHPVIRHVVRCSGDQLATADVFNRALGMLPKMEDQFRLGYSISVAPETFPAPAAQLGAPVLGTMQWDNHTGQPGRTSYASVCQEKPVIRTSMHPLCLMVARQVDSQTVHVDVAYWYFRYCAYYNLHLGGHGAHVIHPFRQGRR
ncbi:hypothetical protein HPB51_028798 [Rhipicephalus microplus]|uniref:Uncharacterized protein n=1 Tax=Rhipicephalus microplus TaxID=6941 RepID=A0A9J6CWB8_RHIMP|nr:hypothetical protein HPB51_028798 [Rhipicephalus microplus]